MISIIIPLFNGEKYISSILNNILKYDNCNFEIIVINDGSTDGSREICEQFIEKDSRIRIINQNNQGICNARNKGIDVALGDYVSFVDQDDMITDDIYMLFDELSRNSYDLIIASKMMQTMDGEGKCIKRKEYIYSNRMIIDKQEINKIALNYYRKNEALNVWNCLYKKSIISENHIRFDESLRYGHEDNLFNIEFLSKCKCVKCIPDIGYIYFRRKLGSTSMKMNFRFAYDYINIIDRVQNCIDTDSDSEDKAIIYTYYIRLLIGLYKQYGYEMKKKDRLIELERMYLHLMRIYGDNQKISVAGDDIIFEICLKTIKQILVNGKYNIADMVIRMTR